MTTKTNAFPRVYKQKLKANNDKKKKPSRITTTFIVGEGSISFLHKEIL